MQPHGACPLAPNGAMRHHVAMQPDIINASAAAKLLGVDRSTIHRRIKRGELVPWLVVGRQPLFQRSDIQAYARGERPLKEGER